MSGPQQIPFSTDLPPSPARQNKVVMQRQYREKEGECFNALRDVIKQLTGEELQTRYEILTKAIYLLSVRRREHVQAVPPVPYEMPVTSAMDPVDTALSYSQQSHWEQSWQDTDLNVQLETAYYEAPSHGHSVSNLDYCGEDWPQTGPQI